MRYAETELFKLEDIFFDSIFYTYFLLMPDGWLGWVLGSTQDSDQKK